MDIDNTAFFDDADIEVLKTEEAEEEEEREKTERDIPILPSPFPGEGRMLTSSASVRSDESIVGMSRHSVVLASLSSPLLNGENNQTK